MAVEGWPELLYDILLHLHTGNLVGIKLFVTYLGGKRNKYACKVNQVDDPGF